jgi:mevalonate kinase
MNAGAVAEHAGKRSRTAFAPGKVILFGEHAVIDGHPAIAATLRRGVTARAIPASSCRVVPPTSLSGRDAERLRGAFALAAELVGRPPLEVRVRSDLPIGAGLGSSAAVAVACARLLTGAAEGDVLALAQAMEGHFHGASSGLDAACAAHGGLVRWGRGAAAAEALHCPVPLGLVVAIDGERPPSRSTIEAVRGSGRARAMDAIGAIAQAGASALEAGDLEAVGRLMSRNHDTLEALGITDARNRALVDRMLSLGALGAKVTGAGGGGGAVLGLSRRPGALSVLLAADGLTAFATEVTG